MHRNKAKEEMSIVIVLLMAQTCRTVHVLARQLYQSLLFGSSWRADRLIVHYDKCTIT